MNRKARRGFALILALVMCLVCMTSCGSKSEETTTEGSGTESGEATFDNVKLSAGSGTAGGSQYVYMGGVANVINSNLDGVELILEGTTGSGENLTLLQSGDLELSCIESSIAYNAYTGASGTKFDSIRSLFVCMPTYFISATLDKAVDNIEDYVGKDVAIGPANSSSDTCSNAVFEALGLTGKINTQTAGWGDCWTALTEGQVYAVTGQALQPSSAITEAESSAKLNFVRLTDEQIQTVLDKYAYYRELTLSKDTYEGLTEDYKTFGSWQAIYATTDMSDDLAYAITKAVFENIDVLKSTIATASMTAMENIGEQPIPLHPGAYKYYVEMGIDVPDALIPAEAK